MVSITRVLFEKWYSSKDKKQLNDLTNLEELREDESETILAIGGSKAANEEEEEEEDDSADKPITLRMLFSSVLNVTMHRLSLSLFLSLNVILKRLIYL